MSPDDAPALPETLLAHTGWMRRLARTLVRDDAQADDVVQDAVVAALRTPPRDPLALPAWLATSVRNGARQLWRGESRRAAREEAAARTEASPGAAEVVARAEEHGLVVQAVLGLDEPYRSALLLRFYDDLPPRDVAKRLGVPVETARARIRRGVEKLRERLDGAHGGDGKTWRLALVPLTFHHGPAALSGSSTGAAAGSKLTTGAMIMAGSGATAAVGGLALVIGVASGWWLGATKSDEIAIEHSKEIAAARAQVTTIEQKFHEQAEEGKKQAEGFRALQAQFRTQSKDFEELGKRLEETTAALAEARAALAKASPAPVAAAPAAKGPRFAFGEFGKLADVDWKSVGDNLSAMAPLCDDVMKKLNKGGELPGEELGKIQQHNGPLVAAAVKVMRELPGTGANGSFTHPAFMVNAIAATLEAAGKALTQEEATALERIAREFSDEDAHRLQAYDASVYALQKTYDEADLRRRFVDAAFAALTEDQRNTLTPPSIKGMVGFDLFSDGLIWATVMRPMPFKEKDTDTLVNEVANALNTPLKLPKEQQDAARAVVAKWAQALPASLVTASDAPGSEYSQKVEDVREGAKQVIALLQRLVADLKLEGPSAEAARRWPVVLLPKPSRE